VSIIAVGRLVKPKTSLSPRDVVEPEEGIWPEAPKEMAEVLDYTGEGSCKNRNFVFVNKL